MSPGYLSVRPQDWLNPDLVVVTPPAVEWPYTPVALLRGANNSLYALDNTGVFHANPPVTTDTYPNNDPLLIDWDGAEWIGNNVRAFVTRLTDIVPPYPVDRVVMYSDDNAITFHKDVTVLSPGSGGLGNSNGTSYILSDHRYAYWFRSGPNLGLYTAGDDRSFALELLSANDSPLYGVDIGGGHLWRMIPEAGQARVVRAAIPVGALGSSSILDLMASLDGNYASFIRSGTLWRANFMADTVTDLGISISSFARTHYIRSDAVMKNLWDGRLWVGSPDMGTWTMVEPAGTDVIIRDISPGPTGTWWAVGYGNVSGNQQNGVYKSTDSGVTWSFIASTLPVPLEFGGSASGFTLILGKES
jgi:hypothetical protein